MGKITKNTSNSNENGNLKVKRRRECGPRDTPPQQRSSAYRGVTRHRWTGRYEAHLWDKNCWNETENKKGRQVYLGAYDDEEVAAHAYDLAALKYWGGDTVLNFPLSTYQEELKKMEGQSKEGYIGSLRRKSSGFSRGVSKYRGVARHHQNGRWEARIGRVFGNKYLYLGTYATQEEAATAYDMAAVAHRGPNALTNFDLRRYVKWLGAKRDNPNTNPATPGNPMHRIREISADPDQPGAVELGLLLQSSRFKEMLERIWEAGDHLKPPESDHQPPSRCSFREEEVQTSYFEWHNCENYADDDDVIFGELGTLTSSIFQYELDT